MGCVLDVSRALNEYKTRTSIPNLGLSHTLTPPRLPYSIQITTLAELSEKYPDPRKAYTTTASYA